MASITWSNTSPADTVTFTSMASRIQSIWTSISTGLNQSLYWQDGSANSDGEFKTETFRTALAPEIWARRTTAVDGYLVQEKMSGNVAAGDAQEGYRAGGFYHVGSSDTFCVGSPFMQEHALDPVTAAPITARWVIRAGTLEGVSLSSVAAEVTTSVITFSALGRVSVRATGSILGSDTFIESLLRDAQDQVVAGEHIADTSELLDESISGTGGIVDSTVVDAAATAANAWPVSSNASHLRVFLQVTQDNDNPGFKLQTGDDVFIGIQRISKTTAESVISWAANGAATYTSESPTVNIAWLSEGTEVY